jgi:iron(III) transport system ATP-binding protein
METVMSCLLRVNSLSKRFDAGSPRVVDNVSFCVAPNEIYAILGPSGCGKTTTLRMMAGFERVDSGSVELHNRVIECQHTSVPAEKRGIGFVFQEYALFPHLDVKGNVGFGLSSLGKRERNERVQEMLLLTGMGSYADRKPHELSGGQQQRVALARALAPMPEIIFLDEPFSNLDAVMRMTTRQEVRNILKRAGTSAVLVTHDQEEALSFADRIAVMNEGRVEQIGTPEEVYYSPRTEFVALFLGRTNVLHAQASGMEAITDLGDLMINRPARGDIKLSIRPEHLTLERATERNCNGLCGTVLSREFKGHDITYKVKVRNGECLVHTDNRMPFTPGDSVVVTALEPAVVLEG